MFSLTRSLVYRAQCIAKPCAWVSIWLSGRLVVHTRPPESQKIESSPDYPAHIVSRETFHNPSLYTPNNIAPTTLYAAFYGMENPGGGRVWVGINRGA